MKQTNYVHVKCSNGTVVMPANYTKALGYCLAFYPRLGWFSQETVQFFLTAPGVFVIR